MYFPRMKRILMVLVFSVSFSCIQAQQPDSSGWAAEVDARLEQWMETFEVPGVAIIGWEQGVVIDTLVRGWADQDRSIPLSASHRFPLGRLTQSLTAVGVLKLAAEGSVKLDLPVNTYLNRWEVSEGPYNPGDVTPRGLLSHTGGINAWPDKWAQTDTASLIARLEGKGAYPEVSIRHRPGAAYRYAAAGYLILQLMLEDVTGMTYPAFMQDSLFASLDVPAPAFTLPEEWAAFPHDRHGRSRSMVIHPPSQAGSGAWMSPLDLSRFWLVLYQTQDSTYQKVLRQLQRPQVTLRNLGTRRNNPQYTFGFFREMLPDSTALLYMTSKVEPGWYAQVYLHPHSKSGLMLMANGRNAAPVLNRMVSIWSTRNDWPAPHLVNRHFWGEYAARAISVVILLLAGYLGFWLYQSRTQRTFRSGTSMWQVIILVFWSVLTALFLFFAAPMLEDWLPWMYPGVLLPLLVYLLLLLLWILFPRRGTP